MTQNTRLLAYLRANPGASRLDISRGMDPFIANVTARISEIRAQLRAEGGDVVVIRRPDGYEGWVIREPLTLGLRVAS